MLLFPTLLLCATPLALTPIDDHADEIRSAGKDVAKLIQLAEAWTTADEREAAQAAWKRVLELDAANPAAHGGLGHKLYDGQWFETFAALSAHRRAEAERMLTEHGKVRFGEEWVPLADLPFLRMGWVRQADAWQHPDDAAAAQESARLAAEGWQKQDGVWVHPDDFDKWRAGQWRVGEEWVGKEEANAHHSRLDSMWEIEGERFRVHTTCDRDSGAWVAWWADKTYEDLVRIFGLKPAGKPRLVCVKDIPQYNVFAGGDPATGWPPGEGNGWSSVHYAFFGEALFDQSATPVHWKGSGACYWDVNDESLKPYGQHAVRHAAGQSYVDAIDPSWDEVSRVASGSATFQSAAFWAAKRIPLWLRYGACAYVERYFRDTTVDAATQDEWWAREWALENLRGAGGLRDLEELFAFQIDPNDPTGSGRMIQEAGLLVAFVLDGGCKPAIDAHQAFKAALRSGQGLDEAVQDLRQAIVRNERKLRQFAGL